MKANIDLYTEVKDCIYKDEHYSVRDNGAVFRHAKDITKPRKLDEQWLFGTKNEKTGYYDHREPSCSYNCGNCISR